MKMIKNKNFIIIVFVLIIAIILLFTGCNKQIFDFDYTYDVAICYYGEERLELTVETWKDYEGEQLQIKSNGKTYLLSANNCYLIDE